MKNSSKMLAAAAIGVVAGSVLALLFAPNKGEATREKIAKKKDKMLKTIQGKFGKEKLTKIRSKLEDKLEKINEKIAELSTESAKDA